MKTWRSRVAAVLAIMVLVPAFVLSATISGSLRDGNWELITETMNVSIAPYQTNEWTTMTTSDGMYEFTDVAEGQYWLYAESDEEDSWYVPVYFPGTWMPMLVPPIEIIAGGDYSNMDFFIELGGRVQGSVLPEEGGEFPVDGIALGLATEFDMGGSWVLENPADFVSPPIPAGYMVLMFRTTSEEDYHVTTFSGNTWNLYEAEGVDVMPGQVTQVGAITMPMGGAISGLVTGQGEPLMNTYINAHVIPESPFEPPAYLAGTMSGADGHYLLRGVPAGVPLVVYFMPPFESEYNSEYYDNAASFESADQVFVVEGEVLEGIDADLQPGASFYGTIRNPGGSLPTEEDWYEFTFFNEGGEEFWANVNVNTDGTWEANSAVPSGTYTLYAQNFSDPLSLGSFMGNVVWPWEADWVQVGGGEEVGPIDLELGHAGSIRGHLTDPDGNTYEYADVFLIKDGNRLFNTSVDFEGLFAFDNIPAGEYVIVAKPWLDEEVSVVYPAVYSGNVGIESEAQSIAVVNGQISQMDLQFQEGGTFAVTVYGPDDLPYYPFEENVGVVVFPVSPNGEILWDVQGTSDDFFVYDTSILTLPVGTWTLVAVPVYLDFLAVGAPPVMRSFLGDVDNLAEASTFNVTTGSFHEGVFHMAEGGSIVGGTINTVTGSSMTELPTVMILDHDGMPASVFASFYGGTRDRYKVRGVPDGEYHIFAGREFDGGRFVSTWYPEVGDPGRTIENIYVAPEEAGIVTVEGSDILDADITMQVGSGVLGVDPRQSVNVPTGFALKSAYPNPFNASTSVVFTVPRTSRVKLELVNILGQRVATLEDRAYTAGAHRVIFDATHLTSGLYFIRMEAGTFQAVQKVTLIK